MPTPVSNARQCLAPEASAALDDAVAVARRRGHAQTTSVHVVYALLLNSSSSSSSCPAGGGVPTSPASPSSSSSLLRDALSRARSTAYSPRLQFKALELCFGVALDRLPSATSSHNHQPAAAPAGDDPPVSNSLMAAIKRSQANQRRNPDTFHLYQQQQLSCAAAGGVPSSSSMCGVKVELQQLVLAILDDPVVSRVFADAGFRSTEIKLAVLRPPPPILRFPRAARCPPLFLCNFSAGDGFEPALSPRGFVFPFSPPGGHPCSDGGDDNCRRIGEILARKSGGRNPMLVGVGAGEAGQDFSRAVERQNWAALPPELRGVKLVNMEKEVAELRTSSSDRPAVVRRLEELVRDLESPGTVLSVGDLKEMVEREGEGHEEESFAISEITRLLEVHAGRLWVMGWSSTYETYMKFLSRYPLLDKDWDLQLLPITSVRTAAAGGSGSSFARPPSLMESFVPFGGFFPTTSEPKSLLGNPYPSALPCEHCKEKYEQEVAILLKTDSEGQQNTNLPFWLGKGNISSSSDAVKAKDDKAVLNSKIIDLQKKWNEYCRNLHRNDQLINNDKCQVTSVCASNQNSERPDVIQNQKHVSPFPISIGLQNKAAANHGISLHLDLEERTKDMVSNSDQVQREDLQSHQSVPSDLGNDEHASSSSVPWVSTDFVLGNVHSHRNKEEKPVTRTERDIIKDMHESLPLQKLDALGRGAAKCSKSSFSICPDSLSNNAYTSTSPHSVSRFPNACISDNDKLTIDIGNYKCFYRNLIEKVGRQEEALSSIVQAIACCRSGERRRGASLKGDIWLGLHGSDRVAKKKTAKALAELICGSKENFTCIDLTYHDGVSLPSTICNQQEASGHDVRFRGKTNADYIAGELSKKPRSVVFLENVDKADFLVQNSLSHAIQNGKFPDSHGREFSINNAIFILTTSTPNQDKENSNGACINFCEENIIAAKCSQMTIDVEPFPEVMSSSPKANVSVTPRQKSSNKQVSLCSVFVSKRKLDSSDDCNSQCESPGSAKRAHKSTKALLDLNLPVEESDENDADTSNSESGNSESWMDDFLNLLDARVNFKPFDFDALADDILKDLSKRFCNVVGSECLLEIDPKVMDQILAAAWSAEDKEALNNWFDNVLAKSFVELNRRHNLSTHNVVKLNASGDAYIEKCAPCVALPSRIILD